MEEWKPQNIDSSNSDQLKYLELKNGYLNFADAKKLTFGVGDNTVKIDNTVGFWTGDKVYAKAGVRISKEGRLILQSRTSLPTTGTVGELVVSSGSLYLCTISSPITWSKVG